MPKFLKNLTKDPGKAVGAVVVFGAIGVAIWAAYKAKRDAQAAAQQARMTAPVGGPRGPQMIEPV